MKIDIVQLCLIITSNMLQPRSTVVFFLIAILINTITGDQNINSSPRRRRQEGEDVTTVLLVDSHGRSTFGRFLSVKPDLGLLTSTARTFIQEGVTTEYATQVLGTTLDNGRLYAHLLTKSSRVLYDNDQPTRSHQVSGKKWNVDNNLIGKGNFVKNTDFISPSQAGGPFIVFPTTKPEQYRFIEKNQIAPHKETSDEELLSEPSNNPRVPFGQENKKDSKTFSSQNNVKVFQIHPQQRNVDIPNYKDDSEENNVIRKDEIGASKVREWDNLPTFTVRNEFSPSGFSYLGDLPDFDINTERTKQTTAAERRAKLLFRGGIPNKHDLKTVTYTGFADFTTTVGETVIVFTPQTEAPKPVTGHVTKISGLPTIQPTRSLHEPPIKTKLKTFLNHEPGVVTETVEGHKITMQTTLPTMVIDAFNRKPKNEDMEGEDEHEDIEAKSAVLAREQQQLPTPTLENVETPTFSTVLFSSEIIEPSESQISMLSTPSDEDIAKIFASLQAKAAQEATEPLNTPATTFAEETSPPTNSFAGATTIFFEDEFQSTALVPESTPPIIQEKDEEEEQQEEPNIEEEGEFQTTENDEILEKQTTENIFTTTLKEVPTTNEIEKEITTIKLADTTTEEESTEEQPKIETDVKCTEGHQILPTTVYKTLTYLTTFFIPIDDETSTSIRANEVISTEIGFQTRPCDLSPSPSDTTIRPTIETTQPIIEEEEDEATEPFTQPQETTELQPTTEQLTTLEQHHTTTEQLETTPMEITTERRHVTESEPETAEITTESGEEIELLFKTLYTTYTYLTTYFQDSTSSIASRKEVITNIVTSTIDPKSDMTDEAIAGLIGQDFKSRPVSFQDIHEISPSGVGSGGPSALPEPNNDNAPENILDSAHSTPALNDEQLLQTINAIKTYYTTYTYFTTIFVDGETEISSRTEVYTNYVTPTASENIAPTAIASLDDEIKNKILALNVAPDNAYNSTINRFKSNIIEDVDNIDNNIVVTSALGPKYHTLERTTTESSENDLLDLSEYETISTMVTDVRSSTSEGDKRIIDNVDKRNVLLDDQIVSESNNESEIIPSPTLLLQTSYTTFTYFTTMYQGTTSSNIVSRLETVTNIVTETLTPTASLSPDDTNLPTTHFTTFTYWTTYYKDGTTKVTNREETVTNIEPVQAFTVPPTLSIAPTAVIAASEAITPTSAIDLEASKESDFESITTVYTTYTYYTTSYNGNSTILNSRLETQSHILNKSDDIESNQIARAIGAAAANSILNDEKAKVAPTIQPSLKPTGLLSTVKSTVDNNGTQTVFATDVYGTYIDGLYAKVLESSSSVITPTIAPSVVQENLKPTGIVSINKGKIVDADSISTLFYTTQAIGTYIDNLYAQVIESTSSLKVDEEKKALQTEPPAAHRTGLVRLIEGSIVHSHTTTLYQSKVLGTVIDGRYAQIIESTSSFIVETIKPSIVASGDNITPTPTQAPGQIAATDLPISPSPVVIEGSISDSDKLDEESSTEIDDEESSTEDSEGNGRVKSRLTFQSRKRTFTPIIRPFASRSKPTFAPKRKGPKASSATTITRSDFTPTVTAIPATKSGNRFGGGRKSSVSSVINPSASGSRRFSRPRSSSAVGGSGPSSAFSPNRGRSSGRIQPTASVFGSSSRRGGFRSSSASSGAPRPSSAFSANNRFRIRPTLASPLNRSPNSNAVTLPSTISDDENDLTTLITDNPSEVGDDESTAPTTTVDGSKRNPNPLLRFRRPPISRPPTTPRSAAKSSGNRNAKASNKPVTTTPKPTRGFYARPNAIPNRVRNANSLFPRRNLFTTTTSAPDAEEDEEEDLEDSDDVENEDGDDEDTEYEGSNTNTQTENPPVAQNRKGRAYTPIQIKPFIGIKRRTKRQSTYSRFRRPNQRTTTTTAPREEPTTEASKPSKGRFIPRNRNRNEHNNERKERPTSAPTRISPSRPKPSHGRSQFTLRDTSSNSRSSFKRPTVSSGIRKPTPRSSSRLRPQTERTIKNNNNDNDNTKDTSRKSSRTRSKSTARRGSISRPKSNPDIEVNYVLPGFDGTITVTYQIPTEVTIPVVNGKVTEYKNIVTAQLRTEVLGPKEYSTTTGPLGTDITILVSESTGIGANGATQITKYTLNETPTTTVIFTPTYIRGRKTSYSHIIPSTVYVADPVVKTIAPALPPQAPLANILLSQLLLGNPIQQQNLGLGLQNPGVPASPTTEFKTRTTTYVTTVTAETSTVIPLTFRGKEILTTIIDTSVNVITATEFITDTVVVTPTAVLQQNNQLNSLLVPLLLQQQQNQAINPLLQQQQGINPLFQQPAGVISTNEDIFKKSLFDDHQNFAIGDSEDYQSVDDITEAPRRKTTRKKPKKPAPTPAAEPVKETSVITLYVSGRTPGEFSTVLSTVVIGEDNKRKREATYIPVEPSRSFDDLIISTLEYVDAYVMPGTKELNLENSEPSSATESLESILGDVSQKYVTDSPLVYEVKPTKSGGAPSKKYKLKYEKAASIGANKNSGNFLA